MGKDVLMISEKRVSYVKTERHGKKIEPEEIMERQVLCKECGNDTFRSWNVENSCACDYDWTFEECTQCGATESGEVFYE